MRTALYLNGSIYTLDARQPRVSAMAVDLDSGRILAAGSDDEIRRIGGQHTERFDLRQHTVIPGFIDAHIHLLMTAQRSLRVVAANCTGEDAVADLVRTRAEQTPRGQWIIGGYWDRNLWPTSQFPTYASLDAAAPHHPVILWSKDAHTVWCNSLALKIAGITAETPDPPTGAILRDGQGNPTGLLQESSAIDLVSSHIEPPTREQNVAVLEQLTAELRRLGITSIQALEDASTLDLLQVLRTRGTLGVRVFMIHRHYELHRLSGPSEPTEDHLLRTGGIKIFADGTLGSQTAAMLEGYEGDPNNYGILTIDTQEMLDAIQIATERGLLVAIHAIGDRAAHVVLDAIEPARQWLNERIHAGMTPPSRMCYRIEHAQLLTPEDLKRMKDLDVIASIQPFHAVADRDIAPRHWGQRARQSYAYGLMHTMGIKLALGSDAPVELYDPLRILYAATVRSDPTTQRPPWQPEYALSMQSALEAYTSGAARAGGEFQEKGQLVPGKLGDAVVLREDLLTAPPETVHTNEVVATIMGGKIVSGTL